MESESKQKPKKQLEIKHRLKPKIILVLVLPSKITIIHETILVQVCVEGMREEASKSLDGYLVRQKTCSD